jgi:hypothetical protein
LYSFGSKHTKAQLKVIIQGYNTIITNFEYSFVAENTKASSKLVKGFVLPHPPCHNYSHALHIDHLDKKKLVLPNTVRRCDCL